MCLPGKYHDNTLCKHKMCRSTRCSHICLHKEQSQILCACKQDRAPHSFANQNLICQTVSQNNYTREKKPLHAGLHASYTRPPQRSSCHRNLQNLLYIRQHLHDMFSSCASLQCPLKLPCVLSVRIEMESKMSE